jgi:F-box protein 11
MSDTSPMVDSVSSSDLSMKVDEELLCVSVSQKSGSEFSTISAALSSQPAGARFCVIVDGGIYEEAVIELKDGVHIRAKEGCGPETDNPVVLAARADQPAVCSRAKDGLLSGLKIEHSGPFGSMACIVVESGSVRIENCVVSGSVSIGLLVCGASTPVIDSCKIQGCCGDGIKIADTAAPTLSNCEIHDNDGFGVFCTGASAGLFKDNKIFANSNAGVAARGTCTGTFQGNRVHDGKQGGFWLEEEAQCLLIANDIYMNQKSGIQVGGHANPTVMKNIVRDGLKGGIVVHDHASGSFLQVMSAFIVVHTLTHTQRSMFLCMHTQSSHI